MPLLLSKAIYYAYSNATLSALADDVLDASAGPKLLASSAWVRRARLLSDSAERCPKAAPDTAARKLEDIRKLQVGRNKVPQPLAEDFWRQEAAHGDL